MHGFFFWGFMALIALLALVWAFAREDESSSRNCGCGCRCRCAGGGVTCDATQKASAAAPGAAAQSAKFEPANEAPQSAPAPETKASCAKRFGVSAGALIVAVLAGVLFALVFLMPGPGFGFGHGLHFGHMFHGWDLGPSCGFGSGFGLFALILLAVALVACLKTRR